MSVPIGSVADNIAGQLGSFADLLSAAMFLVGIGMGAMAALKFKAYNEDPDTHSLGGAIAPLMLSACMIGFPAFLSTFNGTLDPAYTASAAEEPQQDSTPELTSATAPQDPVEKPIQVGVDSVENGQRSEAKWVTERSIK